MGSNGVKMGSVNGIDIFATSSVSLGSRLHLSAVTANRVDGLGAHEFPFAGDLQSNLG